MKIEPGQSVGTEMESQDGWVARGPKPEPADSTDHPSGGVLLPPSGAAFLIHRPEADTWPSRLSSRSPAILLIPIADRPLARIIHGHDAPPWHTAQTLPAGEAAGLHG